MRRYLLSLLIALVCSPVVAEQLEWFTDAQAALTKAHQENKVVFMNFTGSDWNGWCLKLKSDVFDQPEFAQYARENLVLVEVDFPRQKAQDAALQRANLQLAKACEITGFPTIVLVNQDGQMIGRFGYRSGGPTTFISDVNQVVASWRKQSAAPVAGPSADAEKPVAPRKPLTLAPIPPQAPIHYGKLALKGISGPKARRVALINNATLMAGETAVVKTQDHEVVVTCKEIHDDSVLITADDKPVVLTLKNR